MLANTFRQCQSFEPVLESASFIWPSRPWTTPCVFGLSPEFSTPVEKTVEIRGRRKIYESLGGNPRQNRNEGEPSQLLYLVPADELHRRGPAVGNRSRP